jgi:hypothetical protein
MADGGLHYWQVHGSQQRQRCLIEDFREGSVQSVADKFGTDAGGTRIEVRQQCILQVVEHPTRPKCVPAHEPESPEAADQEIISRRGEPWTSADEVARCAEHLCRIAVSERLMHDVTNRVSAWQLVETADTPVQREYVSGVSDGCGLDIHWQIPRRLVVGARFQSEVDVCRDRDHPVTLVHWHSLEERSCMEYVREVRCKAQAKWGGQARPCL